MKIQDKVIGIIGVGKMGEAILRGIIASEVVSPSNIVLCEKLDSTIAKIEKEFSINIYKSPLSLVEKADIVFICVKPQDIKELLEDISLKVDPKRHIFISIAAGIPIKFIANIIGEKTKIIRTMPNTPALISEGVIAISSNPNIDKESLEMAKILLATLGETVVVPERLMDTVTGLSGSGPAYVFLFIESLIEAGVRMGLHRDTALTLATQTVLGATKLLIDQQKEPSELKAWVTSPGGTTAEGLFVLEKGAFKALIMEAVERASMRSKELSSII